VREVVVRLKTYLLEIHMIRSTFTLVAAFTLSACAPAHSRGVVAMKISDTEAHVCVGEEEVHAGSEIEVLRNVCRREKPYACELKLIGIGRITELLNDHYSVATFPAGLSFQEGDLVRAAR
jgi:hypothetical protein